MATQAKNQMSKRESMSGEQPSASAGDTFTEGVDALADRLGLSEADIERATQQTALVNLDEASFTTVKVAIIERVPEQVTLWNGEPGVRYRAVTRLAELDLNVGVDLQFRAFAVFPKLDRVDRSDPQALADIMAPLVLEAWRMTEPDMTEERLRAGVDAGRMSRLFQILFHQTNRP